MIKRNGKILLCRRSPEEKLEGYWEFPGGKVEENETDCQCLKRELLEELSLETEVTRFITESTHHYDEFSLTLVLYATDITKGVPSPTVHDRTEWVDPIDLLNWNLAPADIPLAEVVIKELQASRV